MPENRKNKSRGVGRNFGNATPSVAELGRQYKNKYPNSIYKLHSDEDIGKALLRKDPEKYKIWAQKEEKETEKYGG